MQVLSFSFPPGGASSITMTGSSGEVVTLTQEQAERVMEAGIRPPTETAEQLEADVHQLLGILFAETHTHSVKIDGVEIGVEEGSHPDEEYLMYINGHTLRTVGDTTTYTCLTYLGRIEMEEQLVIRNGRLTAALINTFDFGGVQTSAPQNPDWRGKLSHIRDLLACSVRRWRGSAHVPDHLRDNESNEEDDDDDEGELCSDCGFPNPGYCKCCA